MGQLVDLVVLQGPGGFSGFVRDQETQVVADPPLRGN